MVPTCILILLATLVYAAYLSPKALRHLAARCLTRAHVIEAAKREHTTRLAEFRAEFGLDREPRIAR